MKVVILAAGKGSRLGDPDLPKPLTELANGKSLLGLQLEHLSQSVSLDDVLVVVGFHKERIMDQFPDLLYVYNPDFAQENTSKSLLRALRKVQEDVLWLNGDVVFHPSVLKSVLSFKKTCMLVNRGPVAEEEVKYRCDPQGHIVEVSKQVAAPEGEALGINFFKSADLALLRAQLELCAPNDYFEKAIEFGIEEDLEVWPVVIDDALCTEVDFPEDLERANRLITSWY